MKLDLYINETNDYARDIRVPILHPHVVMYNRDERMQLLCSDIASVVVN